MKAIRFTEEEERYIEHRAKRLRMSQSDYLRYAAIYEGICGADAKALNLMRKRTLARVRNVMAEFLAGEGLCKHGLETCGLCLSHAPAFGGRSAEA